MKLLLSASCTNAMSGQYRRIVDQAWLLPLYPDWTLGRALHHTALRWGGGARRRVPALGRKRSVGAGADAGPRRRKKKTSHSPGSGPVSAAGKILAGSEPGFPPQVIWRMDALERRPRIMVLDDPACPCLVMWATLQRIRPGNRPVRIWLHTLHLWALPAR